MNTRDAQLIALRPELPQVSIHDQMSDQEFFQNKTLRPILTQGHEVPQYFKRAHSRAIYP